MLRELLNADSDASVSPLADDQPNGGGLRHPDKFA